MKKYIPFIIAITLFLCSPAFAVDDDESHTVWYASSLSGGGSGSLDGAVSGVSIGPYDVAIVKYVDTSGVTRVNVYYVTLYSEAESLPTVIRPDDVGAGVTSWHKIDFGYPDTTYMDRIDAQAVRSGASGVIGAPGQTLASGLSIFTTHLNTIIVHNTSGQSIYGLHPISGETVIMVKFIEGALGGGITVYTADTTNEAFRGTGSSGVSYLALPPGNPHEKCTVYGIQESGSCKYWSWEGDSNWEAGN